MIKFSERQTIKNITNEEMHHNELELDRKGFIVKWQKQTKKNIKCVSDEYLKIDNDLAELLKQIGNTELSNNIRNIIDDRENIYACERHKQGIFEGVKLALIIKKKNLSTPIQ